MVGATSPELTAIIVAYNSEEIIASTVGHLEEISEGIDIEILVVDNASSDNSSDRARSALKRGRVIRSEENLGFGRGANIALRQATGDFVLMMNDDVWPRPGCLEEMLEVAKHDSVGLVGARMVDSEGADSFAVRSHLPGLADEFARIGDKLTGRSTRTDYPSDHEPIEVGLLICACVMTRTQTLRDFGGFNDAYFMYGEDIDLCRRLKTGGLKLVTVPTAIAVHERDVAPDRRIKGHDFSEKMLDSRNKYYRTWLSRPERMLINLIRAFSPADQPFRLRYHLPKVIWDGTSLEDLRTPHPMRPGDPS